MKAYLDLVRKILEEGEWKGNRTGTRAKSISGYMLEHNMADGFPLTTTKRTAFKMIAVELEFFIKGLRSKQWLKDRGCHIWDEWHSGVHDNFLSLPDKEYALQDNDLGPIYGFQWRSFNKYCKPSPTIHTEFSKKVKCVGGEDDPFIGFTNKGKYGEYVVEKKAKKGRKGFSALYQVVFTSTGYRNTFRKDAIKKDKIKDPYFPNVCGVACLGDYSKQEISNSVTKELLKTWRRIIHRCYDKENDSYFYYGGEGVYVSNKWLIFENFLSDAIKMDNWNKKVEDVFDWTVERVDINKPYDSNNCIWLHKKDQIRNRRNALYYNVFNKKGKLLYEGIFSSDLSEAIKIPYHSLRRYADEKSWRGYVIKSANKIAKRDLTTGYDQFKSVVDKLHSNPSDRRMIVSAWNPNQLHQMALPPCHLLFQVVVTGENFDTLNMNWYQRSVDTMLGLPFNIASYALLLKLLAMEAGMKEGKLCGMLGDVHIYENHIETAKIQLERKPFPLPKLEIPEFTNIWDWTYEQRKLIDYQSHDKLEYPIAV